MTGSGAAPRISARGLVIDSDGRYLLIERRRAGRSPYLVVPGGGVERGETLQEAVRRECEEELGAAVAVGEVLHIAFQTEPMPGSIQWFFLCRLASIDIGTRSGPEPADAGRGSAEPVCIRVDDPRIDTLRPTVIAELISMRHEGLVAAAAALGTVDVVERPSDGERTGRGSGAGERV